MSYGLDTVCKLCGEPMSKVYFLENILGTMDSVVSCTDKKCDYWECMPDYNRMADYGFNQDGTALTEKGEEEENKQLREENRTGHWLTDKYFNEILHLKEINKRLREGIKAYLNLEIETHELKEMIE